MYVCQVTGCTYRMLDYWVRTGIVSASVPARGSGTQRRFSERDVIDVAVVRRLTEANVHLRVAREAILRLREVPNERLESVWVVAGATAVIVANEEEVLDLVVLLGGVAVVLSISQVADSIRPRQLALTP